MVCSICCDHLIYKKPYYNADSVLHCHGDIKVQLNHATSNLLALYVISESLGYKITSVTTYSIEL